MLQFTCKHRLLELTMIDVEFARVWSSEGLVTRTMNDTSKWTSRGVVVTITHGQEEEAKHSEREWDKKMEWKLPVSVAVTLFQPSNPLNSMLNLFCSWKINWKDQFEMWRKEERKEARDKSTRREDTFTHIYVYWHVSKTTQVKRVHCSEWRTHVTKRRTVAAKEEAQVSKSVRHRVNDNKRPSYCKCLVCILNTRDTVHLPHSPAVALVTGYFSSLLMIKWTQVAIVLTWDWEGKKPADTIYLKMRDTVGPVK